MRCMLFIEASEGIFFFFFGRFHFFLRWSFFLLYSFSVTDMTRYDLMTIWETVSFKPA